LAVLDLKQFPLVSLQPLAETLVQYMPLEGPDVLSAVTTGLGQSKNQDDQRALQHHLSFGSLTLPPKSELGLQKYEMARGV
jgi:hypothetical protein